MYHTSPYRKVWEIGKAQDCKAMLYILTDGMEQRSTQHGSHYITLT
jgi:stage III sporulation protein SpoIIIAA